MTAKELPRRVEKQANGPPRELRQFICECRPTLVIEQPAHWPPEALVCPACEQPYFPSKEQKR